MTSNSLSFYSESLSAFVEQATCANPLWSISSTLLPQMSSSAGPPNERNSQRIEEVVNVPNAPAIHAAENTEVDALFCGTQPTTAWSKHMDCLAFHLLRVRDSLTAISNCLRNSMWTIDRNNNVEETDGSGYTSNESFQFDGHMSKRDKTKSIRQLEAGLSS